VDIGLNEPGFDEENADRTRIALREVAASRLSARRGPGIE
jgi:hypothetical protein